MKGKNAQKSQHKTKRGSDAKKKPNKRRKATVSSDAEASATDSHSEDSDSGADTQDGHSGEEEEEDDDEDKDKDKEVVQEPTSRKALGTRVWIRGAGRVPSHLPTLLLIPSRSMSLPCLLHPTVLCHLRRLLIPCHPPQWTPSLSCLTLLPCPVAR